MRLNFVFALPWSVVVIGCGSIATSTTDASRDGANQPDTRSNTDASAHADVTTVQDVPIGVDVAMNRDVVRNRDVATIQDTMVIADTSARADVTTIMPSDSGVIHNGNPNGSCNTGVPARGQPADISHPTTVIGTGTPASCTLSQLSSAIHSGGVITFNCGSAPVTIPITTTLNVPIDRNTVIDGGGTITLDGGNAVQILRFASPDFAHNESVLTLQHIALINGRMTPTAAIPVAPAPCSQGYDDGEGGAVYMRDGNLVVIDSLFENNHAALLGPDTGGGAIYVVGSRHGVLIANSTFRNNSGSNAGAVGCLIAELDVYNSVFMGNTATGHGANSDDASQCSVINNGQHEVGSGGNGGALYLDGNSVNVLLCGDQIAGNSAGMGAFGGGLFFTSDDWNGTLFIGDTTMSGNTGGHWTSVQSGGVTNVGTAIGVNAQSITVTNSMLQGM